jgi:hypothetical protein
MSAQLPAKDLGPRKLEGLSWDPAKVNESLDTVAAHASLEAEEAIAWYLKKKRPKELGARWLRVGAILATAIAGLIPIWIQMYPLQGGAPPFPPAWASVAVAIAALLIVLDQFLGCSTGWMRFILTQMRIRRILEVFRMDWETEKSAWKGQPPTAEQVQKMLALARNFLGEVHNLVEGETSAWAEEFKSSLKQIDEAARAKAEVKASGGVNVTVTNGGQCDTGWELSIDDGAPKKCGGTSAGVSGLTPALHAIKVIGAIQGQPKRAEKLVTVPVGAAAPVELTLA